MLNGLYSAGSAMDAAARRHELISQNLAFAQVPGYRRQTIVQSSRESQFDDALKDAVRYEVHGVHAGHLVTDFTPGVLERTDHPLDMAIQGEGFFVVEGPNGPLYTRNGAFQLDADGRLVTADMLPVQGEAGEITLPPNTSLTSLTVAQDGSVFVDNTQIGKLQVVSFSNPQLLQKAGATLYSAPPQMPPMTIDGSIAQNMREHSNVSPIQELVYLIAAQRQQEAAQRSMSLLSEAVSKNINLNGR